MQVQLQWPDPQTREIKRLVVATPVVLGSDPAQMPEFLGGQQIAQAVFKLPQIAPFHALIGLRSSELWVQDRSGSGVKINNTRTRQGRIAWGDRLQLGSLILTIQSADSITPDSLDQRGECEQQVGFLFKRRCGRRERLGCPYCFGDPNRQEDPETLYADDYRYYPNYSSYNNPNYWGYDSYRYGVSDDSELRQVDFTEADAEPFVEEQSMDYELSLDAS